jgi:peptidoglycan-associated lipoprotein
MIPKNAPRRASLIGTAILSVVMLSACDTVPTTYKPETAVYVHHVYKPVAPPLSPLDDPNSVLARRSVYFDSNSVELKPSDRVLLQAHADYMRANPTARVRVEGHADYRGAGDFNQSLGFRRAEVVRNFMRQNGVADGALEVMSYGRDNPIDSGRSEDARSRNRRVDLRYLAR